MYVLYFKVKTYIQLRWNEFLLANGECEVKKKPQAKKVAVAVSYTHLTLPTILLV